jgi:hypothetical protein
MLIRYENMFRELGDRAIAYLPELFIFSIDIYPVLGLR